jgi:hypothetical protein
MTVALIIFLLWLFRPEFLSNAGNALLSSVGNSTAYGSAQVVPSLQGKGSNLQLNLQGLDSNAHYVITLQQGSCSGPVLLTIGGIAADNNGNVTSTFSLAALAALTQQGVWVNVHRGNDASGPSVACGEVQINSSAATQVQNVNSNSSTANNATVINSSSTNASNNYGLNPFASQSQASDGGSFPQTGVAPAKSNSYDNYKFPRKY